MIVPLEEKLNLSTEQLRAIFARPVAYHKLLAIAGGSVGAGVFLSQLIYWTDKSKDPDGWIYKTLDDWWSETALGRYELKTIRNTLVARTLIEEKLCGVPARLHYKIEWPTLQIALAKAVITHRDGMSKRGAPANKYVALPQTGDATGKNGEPPQTIYRAESTTESTKTKSGSRSSVAPTNGKVQGPSSSFLFDLPKEGSSGNLSSVSDQSSPDEVAEALAEKYDFALNGELGQKLRVYLDQVDGVGYVLQKDEVAGQPEYKENPRRAFFAALRHNWQTAPQPAKPKKAKPVPPAEEPQLSFEERKERLAATKAAISTV